MPRRNEPSPSQARQRRRAAEAGSIYRKIASGALPSICWACYAGKGRTMNRGHVLAKLERRGKALKSYEQALTVAACNAEALEHRTASALMRRTRRTLTVYDGATDLARSVCGTNIRTDFRSNGCPFRG
jgi:hypothetical protein